MEKAMISTALLLCIAIGAVSGQCMTANDVIANETAIGAAVRSLIDGSAQFSLDLFRSLHAERSTQKDSQGVFFSPWSVWSALVLAYSGARGPTEVEMKHVLGLGDDKAVTWEAFRNLNDFRVGYESANRLYFQRGIEFKDCVREMLGKEVAFVDFESDAEGSRDQINQWVEGETHQRIKDLIPDGGVDSLTRMVIANAVYFKQSWQQPFEPERTARRRFTLQTRRQIFVSMMTTRGRFLYGKSEELQCYGLELPYSGNTLSMVILLPNNRFSGVDRLAQNLTPQRLNNLLNDMYPREVLVSIPKISMEDNFELSSALGRMGLRTAFDRSRADLSGFTGQKEFAVDAVRHKSFVEVNEEGTEAAGATAVLASRSARPVGPAAFVADYPFVFFIRDNLANVILFMGTVQKPLEV